jgi:hypothetical protein
MAELFAHGNQLLHELAKTTVFGDLRSGAIDRRSLGDDLGHGLSSTGMSQRVGRTVPGRIFLRTMTVRLATLAKARGKRAWTEIVNLSQIGLELFAFLVKSF